MSFPPIFGAATSLYGRFGMFRRLPCVTGHKRHRGDAAVSALPVPPLLYIAAAPYFSSSRYHFVYST